MKLINNRKQNSGSVLLIAILVSTVVLVVGAGVYQRTYKELLFSSMWRQTQIAFGAADAGLECGMYRDLHAGATSCFGTNFAWSPVSPGTWSVNLTVGGACVNIKVIKTGATPDVTTIEARGYNDGCASVNTRRVERGLKVTY